MENKLDKELITLSKSDVMFLIASAMGYGWNEASSHRSIEECNKRKELEQERLLEWTIHLSNGFLKEYTHHNPYEMYDVSKVEKLKEKYNFELIDDVTHRINDKPYFVESYNSGLMQFLESYKDKKVYIYSKSLPTIRAIVI
jgi:hypothetical protein